MVDRGGFLGINYTPKGSINSHGRLPCQGINDSEGRSPKKSVTERERREASSKYQCHACLVQAPHSESRSCARSSSFPNILVSILVNGVNDPPPHEEPSLI